MEPLHNLKKIVVVGKSFIVSDGRMTKLSEQLMESTVQAHVLGMFMSSKELLLGNIKLQIIHHADLIFQDMNHGDVHGELVSLGMNIVPFELSTHIFVVNYGSFGLLPRKNMKIP